MTAPLQLRTFGDFLLERVHEDGTAETVYRAGKLLALLLHLTIRDERPQRRAELADLFWGDEAPEKARASLRQAIASLHRLLGESALIATRETVELAPGTVETDHERFLDAVRRHDVDGVMTLYRGSFLAEEPRAGAVFERWAGVERVRLRQLFLEEMQGGVSAALQTNEIGRATEIARAIRVAEPEEAEGVRLLFDALGAGGRRSDARRVIETFVTHLAQSEETLPPDLVDRLERVRVTDEDRVGDAASLEGLGATLVGRETVLSELIAAAEQARRGTCRSVMLVGVSGSGKSRVLDEFDARLRLRGSRTIRIGLRPTMRGVSYAGLAEIIREFALLPGALGVSPVTAATLVEFLPELRRLFPVAVLSSASETDRLRRRMDALLDLTGAIADRRAVSVLIDDAQYLDAETLAVLRTLPSLKEIRLLLVLAAWTPILDGTDGVEVLELPPLPAESIRQMLEGEARWTGANWEGPFVDRLVAITGGLPYFTIGVVQSLRNAGILSTTGGVWSAVDPGRVVDQIASHHSQSFEVGSLTDVERTLLQILSVWGRAIPDLALCEIARTVSIGATEESCRAALDGLEVRGLILMREGAWVLAHDTIAEALRPAEGPRAWNEIRRATVGWWMAQPALDLPMLEHLALLCAIGDDLPLAVALVESVTRSGRWHRGHLLSAEQLAIRLAVASGRPDWGAQLYRAMGWMARRSRRQLAWFAAAVALGCVSLLVTIVMLWPRLRIEVEPLGDTLPASRLGTLHVQPRVGVFNGFGRRLRLSGQVRVRGQSGTRLIGDTIIELTDGRAQFQKLALTDYVVDSSGNGTPVPQHLHFEVSGLIVGASSPIRGMIGPTSDGIRIIRAVINGQTLDSTLTARIPVGTPLEVELTFSYTTPETTVNYVVGAGPTWLDPQTSVIRLAGLPRPIIDAWQTVEFEVSAARRPGHHHLLLLFRAEDSVDHLFSATNWAAGPPVWGDGNDLTTVITEAQVQELRREGVFQFDRYLQGRYRTQQAQLPGLGRRLMRYRDVYQALTPIQGAAIEVDFVEPPR
jgi:DNA-binding SARP family transcriptional activator